MINILFYMVTKRDEFVAEIFKIAGFAMMTPLGKFILDFPYLKKENININMIIYIIISVALCYFGIIVALRGIDILEKEYK